jgi:hypothetical protein
MNETTGRSQDDFETRLFAMIDAGELDFPKGAVRPGVEAAPPPGLFKRLRLRWRGRLGLPRLVLTAAVAYVATFTLSLPVYRALFAPTSVPAPPATIAAPAPPPPSVGSAQVLALGAGPTRASVAARRVTVGASDSFLVLSFLVPIREGAGLVRRAAIHDASGRVVVEHGPIQSADDLGNFVLVCNARLFAAGDYALVVTEAASGSAASAESHRFSFQVVRSRP